jgi:thiosulfate/3-mercaptopyruvate sulfurtransferase
MRGIRFCSVLPVLLATMPIVPAVADSGATKAAQLIVDTEWVAAKLGTPGLVIIEVGTRLDDYRAGHIPGAAYLDRVAIYDTVNGIPGMFPGVDRAVAAFEALGVSNASTVLLYDAADSLWAARAFWALEVLGHEKIRVLNGGLAAWKADGRPVTREAPQPARGTFRPHPQESVTADKATVLSCISDPDVTIVDARTRGEYAGTDVRASRAGHIPGAVNLDWQLAATDDKRKLILDEEELAEMYASAGLSKDKTVIVHCQTGVRAAHTYLVLRSLGYTKVRLYDGSWEEWGNDAATPIVTNQAEGGGR